MACQSIYTEAIHAERLLEILERPEGPCHYCPAMVKTFTPYWSDHLGYKLVPCTICLGFIDLPYKQHGRCPCYRLPQADPIRVSWLALEARGYLDRFNEKERP